MAAPRIWVSAATVAVLVAAVVLVRGDTAADDSDLAGTPTPIPTPSAPVEPVAERLEANGLSGARLGTRPPDSGLSGSVVSESGCQLGFPVFESSSTDTRAQDNVQVFTWVVDGDVTAVFVQSSNPNVGPADGLRTWLGPGLGSSIRVAQELPGADTVVTRPFGAAGPTIHVVTVPGNGVEVVFSDAPSGWETTGDGEVSQSDPVITTIEVRRPAARPCSMADEYSAHDPSRRLDLNGVEDVRLGDGAAALVADGVLVRDIDGEGLAGCQSYAMSDDQITVTAVDGVVAQVQAFGGVETGFGLPAGADLAAVRGAFPQLDPDAALTVEGRLSVVVDSRATVDLDLYPAVRFVPDVENPVVGGPPVVQGVTVRATDVPASSLTC